MSKEFQLKVASDMRDISTDDDFQTPGTINNKEPASLSPLEELSRARLNKPLKMRRNRLGPSEPLIAKPESSQVSAEGKVAALSKRSDTNPDLSAQPLSDDDDPEVTAESKKNSSDPELPTSASRVAFYESDPIEDELAAIPAQPNPTPVFPVVPVQDPFEQGDDQGDDPDMEMDGLQAIARNEMPPPEIQVQGPSNASSNVQSPLVKSGENATTSFNEPLSKSRILSISSIPEMLEATPNSTTSVPDAMKKESITEPADIPDIEPSKLNLPVEPSIDLNDKISRRRRLIRRLRKILLRRRVLSMLLGTELGKVTHTELNQAQGVGSLRSVPLMS